MSKFKPFITANDNALIVTVGEGFNDRRENFKGVIDKTALGNIVGIEILDFQKQISVTLPLFQNDHQNFPQWSYDNDIDAFYLRIADGPAPVQVNVVGWADLGQDRSLIALEVPILL
jgi:uncharacterized protein YuzE